MVRVGSVSYRTSHGCPQSMQTVGRPVASWVAVQLEQARDQEETMLGGGMNKET